MSESDALSRADCEFIRRKYSVTEGFEPLEQILKTDRWRIRYHLYGDCHHDADVEHVVPSVDQEVPAEECASLRRQFADGVTVADLREETGRHWETLAAHLSGECSHDVEPAAHERLELYQRPNVSAADCRALRASFFKADTDDVLTFASGHDISYGTVLRHLNGKCGHNIDHESRTVADRAADVSESECRAIREVWRENPDISLSTLADEFDVSFTTAERHVKFLCDHEYEELVVDRMEAFERYL